MKNLKYLVYLYMLLIVVFSCKKDEPIITTPVVNPIVEPSLKPFSLKNKMLLDSIIDSLLVGNQIPGIVIGVRSPEFGTYYKAWGVSNFQTKIPMKTDAIFGIGSVHKNFKWVLLHILDREGVLNINDLVNSHITKPNLPGVTIKHLMQHSAGLPDIPQCQNFQAHYQANPTFEYSYDTMMYFLNNASGINSYGNFTNGRLSSFTPGVNSSYSSFGPIIAGEIVEQITGKNMRVLIDEKIFKKLNLSSTTFMGFQADPVLLTEGHATYTYVSNFTPSAQSTMGLSSANGGAIHSNVADLLNFTHREFTDSTFISQQIINRMDQEYLNASGMKVGLGIIQFNQWNSSGFWGHAGFGIRSHSSTILHNKANKLSIVVLTNIYTLRDDFQTNYLISKSIKDALH